MKAKYLLGAGLAALIIPGVASAQSTGTQTFENTNSDVVVTGQRDTSNGVAGVDVPKTTKARVALTQDFIERQTPGQTVDDIINYIPGVSYQNNGPYGDAGGTLTIHGFSSSRISQTFDGVPTNDSGNYALYSQEQLDPELIKRVEVSLGSTDIDSPTAFATGSTVNYVMRDPTEDFHARMEGSAGQWDFMRVFGSVDTGTFTKYGTRALFAASNQSDVNPYDAASRIQRTQLNGKLYQPIGNNGDFISLTAFYDVNRGNHFADVTTTTFPTSRSQITSMVPCLTTTPVAGKADKANACGQSAGYYGYGQNPTNIFRVHFDSRFAITNNVALTVEPYYESTEANGGSPTTATEGTYALKNGSKTSQIFGYIGGKPYFGGVDLNGDGDTLDTVGVDAPSNTITHRYGVIANLIWDITPTQKVRVNYTLDHARLRQTGEVGLLQDNGRPEQAFPINDPLLDATGMPIESRNRLSYSILNQVSGEYRGEFFDGKLVLQGGVRAPFFKRDLTNYCVTESGGNGYVDCFNDPVSQAAFLAAHPADQLPQSRNLNYSQVLPSAGFIYNFTPQANFFFNYSEGIQIPSTDSLYDGFAFAPNSPDARAKPEMSFNYEGGLRYNSSKIQAQLSGWYTIFHNRIEEAEIGDPENPGSYLNVFTNLGAVDKYGVDGNIAYTLDDHLKLYAFGSYLHSKIRDNLVIGDCTLNNVKFGDAVGATTCTAVGPVYAMTAGKQESGAPTYMFGGRIQGNYGPLSLGVQAKRTGGRYLNDQNSPVLDEDTFKPLYPAKTPAYTLVDLDARLSLGFLGLNDRTYLQLNVHNLFNEFYVGGFSATTSNISYPAQFVYIGTPRTVSGTINIAF
jgi:iron complex outermembrane receptor protein